MAAIGVIETGLIEIDSPPTQDNHGVRLVDLRSSATQFHFNGVLMSDYFPGEDLTQAGDKRIIYVASTGIPTNSSSTNDAAATGMVGLRFNDSLYTDGSTIKGWSTGMQPGTQFFLANDGTLTAVPQTAAGSWAIRVAIAVNTTDILLSFSIQGKQ